MAVSLVANPLEGDSIRHSRGLTAANVKPYGDVHDGVSRSEILSTLKKHDKYIKEYVYYEMDKNHDRSTGQMNEILTKLKRIEDQLDDIEKVVRKLD